MAFGKGPDEIDDTTLLSPSFKSRDNWCRRLPVVKYHDTVIDEGLHFCNHANHVYKNTQQ